jgi:hypothetical protein
MLKVLQNLSVWNYCSIKRKRIGGDGVVRENVEIIQFSAVPDGDEYDKDIALAIRYAVDNGKK